MFITIDHFTTVRVENLATHVRRIITSEKDVTTGNLFWLSRTLNCQYPGSHWGARDQEAGLLMGAVRQVWA